MKRFLSHLLSVIGIVWLLLTLNLLSCSKDKEEEAGIYSTWVDPVDGMVYKTLELGEQTWLVENINRGEMINGAIDQTDNGIIEKYCYDNNPVLCQKYGGLYQWDEAMQYSESESSQGICPPGWHIPSDNEWKILEIHLGMTREVANGLLWRGIDQGINLQPGGESGFEALRGGTRFVTGNFSQLGNSGFFWTSTMSENEHAWRRGVGIDHQGVYRSVNHKTYGFPVRCLKY